MELKNFIHSTRDRLKQTQKQAAQQVSVSPLTWISWEHGQTPSVNHIFRIADWAGVSVDSMRSMLTTEKKKDQ